MTLQFDELLNSGWGAIKLSLSYDVGKLQAEVRAVSDKAWDSGGRSSAAFKNTKAIFLKGYAAADGNPSKEDRDALDLFPYAKKLIYGLIPAEPQNCVLSYLPARERVGLHIDRGEYFNKTLRIHFPVTTNPKVSMYFGAVYRMLPGEVWLLNNCSPHGVENGHHNNVRIHLICDFLPSSELLSLIEFGDPGRGKDSPKLLQRLRKKTLVSKK